MCGIAGIFGGTKQPNVATLSSMIRALAHRGPDDQGVYQDNRIGLAHARLSIIDLVGGRQPIHNEDKTIWIVFNGEIFNYLELRSKLVAQGHQFYTQTDTEVIIHLYEEYGESFAQKLNGQFAIALWDGVQEKLILVRDHAGILPLFYTFQERRLLFASEVKAILPALEVAPSLNLTALDQIMTFWAPVSPQTIFKDIFEISPGHMLVAHKCGGYKITQYWDWCFPRENEYRLDSSSVLADELLHLLIDSVRIRLRADVPVGAYLSGGLDSSSLVSLIHHHTDTHLRTFSIGFDSSSYDESKHQKQMIAEITAEHSFLKVRSEDISRHFIDTIWHTESPMLRTAPVPMKLLSGLVQANGYKVVLTGEGADEVLGGYDIFKESKLRQFWARQPSSITRPTLLKRLYPYLDVTPGQAQAYLQNFYGVGLDSPNAVFFSHLPRWITTAQCKRFLHPDVKQQLTENAEDSLALRLAKNLAYWHSFNRAQYIEAKTLMAGYLLCSQGDRMLMANSVEGRFPFLDHRVIEFANQLHPNAKMKVLNEKYLLKKAVANYVPKSIVQRHKQPYRAPDIDSFNVNNPPEYVSEMLDADVLNRYGYFDTKKVLMLIRKIKSGNVLGYKDNMAFVGILSTQIWHHLFVESFTRRSIT